MHLKPRTTGSYATLRSDALQRNPAQEETTDQLAREGREREQQGRHLHNIHARRTEEAQSRRGIPGHESGTVVELLQADPLGTVTLGHTQVQREWVPQRTWTSW